jgi:hypothetical protein
MSKYLASIIIFTAFLTPFFAVAQDINLIVCNTKFENGKFTDPCDFNKVMLLVQNFFNFIVVLSVAFSAISFTVAGFKLVTSQGNPSAMSDAKTMLTKTAIGFAIVLSAWLIVYSITSVLLRDGFLSLLGN